MIQIFLQVLLQSYSAHFAVRKMRPAEYGWHLTKIPQLGRYGC